MSRNKHDSKMKVVLFEALFWVVNCLLISLNSTVQHMEVRRTIRSRICSPFSTSVQFLSNFSAFCSDEKESSEETASLMYILFCFAVTLKVACVVWVCVRVLVCVCVCVSVPGTASLLAHTVLTLPCTLLPLWARLGGCST